MYRSKRITLLTTDYGWLLALTLYYKQSIDLLVSPRSKTLEQSAIYGAALACHSFWPVFLLATINATEVNIWLLSCFIMFTSLFCRSADWCWTGSVTRTDSGGDRMFEGQEQKNKLHTVGHHHRESLDTFMVMRENFIKGYGYFSTSTFGHAESNCALICFSITRFTALSWAETAMDLLQAFMGGCFETYHTKHFIGCRMPLKYLTLIKPTVMTLLHYALSGSRYLKRNKLILSGTRVPSWRVFVQQTYFWSSFPFHLVRLIADPKEDLQGREILIAIVSSDAEFFFFFLQHTKNVCYML